MKCDICKKNEAAVAYREIINGNEKVYSLCSACAKNKEIEMSTAFKEMTVPFMGGLINSFFTPRAIAEKRTAEKRCDLCNSTFEMIVKRGKAGCPKCYSVFEAEMAPSVKKLHGNALHVGKSPMGAAPAPSFEDEKARLERELKLAIEKEEYERAAEIRDKLRDIRGGEGA